MKTWEVIKALTEKPYKKFRSTNESLVTEIYVNEKGCIELYYPGLKVGSNNLKLDTDWEEVKEPVDFMEALKSCKRVSVEHPNLFDMPVIYKKNASIATVINYIFESYSDALVREIILNGKWYIEED